MTSDPNYNEDPDTESSTVPPYDGRKESADVDGSEETMKDGARTGGATGPVEREATTCDDPASTRRGEHASPAHEQPASESTDTARTPQPPARRTSTAPGERRTCPEPARAGRRHRQPVLRRRRVRTRGRPPAGRVRTSTGAGARGRLRHPRHAPGLRPARRVRRAGDRRRGARRGPDGQPGEELVLEVGGRTSVPATSTRTGWSRWPCWPAWRTSVADFRPRTSWAAGRPTSPTASGCRRRSRLRCPSPWRPSGRS